MFQKPLKVYGLLIAFTMIIITAFSFIPYAIGSSLKRVDTAPVSKTNMEITVDCSGVIKSQIVRSLYYSYPLMIGKVLVNIGDKVGAGQKIASVSREQTIEALGGQKSELTSVPAQLPDSVSAADYSSLLKQNASAQAAAAQTSTSNPIKTDDIPTAIRAPISGIVTSLNAETGSYTQTAKPVAVISNLKELEILAQVDEYMISGVKAGQKAVVTGDGFGSRYTATVKKIYPTAQQIVAGTGTRTVVNVLLGIQNPGNDLKPGMSANVSIMTATQPDCLTVPYEAISQDNENREFVYVYRNGRAIKTYVETGDYFEKSVSILSGARAGERVILNPPEDLKNGQFVRPED